MLKTLLKKQLLELGRTFVYDEKKKKARSKKVTVAYLVVYFLFIVGVIGGMFTYVSMSTCKPLFAAGVGWLFFVMLGLIGIALGVFGSVFNTFATLYTAKDNDLLLSMPIPEKYIIISRLSAVYLLGTLFSSLVTLPAVIVYFATIPQTAMSIIGSLFFVVVITVIVLTLSCVLGYFVAKISLKLKNKSFVTVIASLLFFAIYYFVYYKANEIIQTIVVNAAEIGEKIKGAASFLYFFGKMGEGAVVPVVVCTLVTFALASLTCYVIVRSFRKITTATPQQAKLKRRAGDIKSSSINAALFRKEMKRFTSSPNYMLNCGFGVIPIIVGTIVLAVKPDLISQLLVESFKLSEDMIPFGVAILLCFFSTMNDTATASVSLEGKSIWISHSLPVETKKVLRAKLAVQLAITNIPLLVGSVVSIFVYRPSLVYALLLVLLPQCFSFFIASFELIVNLKNPNLSWTNEIIPIKQSMSVFIAVLASFLFTTIYAAAGYFLSRVVSPMLVMGVITLINALLGVILFKWIEKKGVRIYDLL